MHSDDPLPSQFILDECFKRILNFKFKSIEADVAVEKLSLEEHNALAYTAGYVPQCLIKEIKKSCDHHKTEFLTCLSDSGKQYHSAEASFQDFTKKWITSVNRYNDKSRYYTNLCKDNNNGTCCPLTQKKNQLHKLSKYSKLSTNKSVSMLVFSRISCS